MADSSPRTKGGVMDYVEAIVGLNASRLPALFGAFVVAELFFKFGSFTLECIAFLVLWRVLDFGFHKVSRFQS